MNADRNNSSGRLVPLQYPRGWGRWAELALLVTGTMLVIVYAPFAHLFGFESFEARHGSYRLEFGIYIACWVVGKLVYLGFFRRTEIAAQRADFQDALAHGRVKRMSLAARWLLIVCILGLVSVGWIAPEPHRTRIWMFTVPLFLLFSVIELNFILHPGESLKPNPSDELLMFFKARMLRAGYITAIAAMAALYLVYLFAPGYIGLLLPLGLAACLLAPSLVYNRLDRRAAADG